MDRTTANVTKEKAVGLTIAHGRRSMKLLAVNCILSTLPELPAIRASGTNSPMISSNALQRRKTGQMQIFCMYRTLTEIGPLNAHIECRVGDPMAPMWPFYSNNTCDPKADASGSVCTLGYLPEYVIVATDAEQVQAGVKFAHENNIRVVIRSSGHDFMGRSTGFGAIAINTHRFDSITFEKNHAGPGNWTGGAVTIGSGVMHRELYEAAFQQSPPVVVVGGECPVSRSRTEQDIPSLPLTLLFYK